MDVEQSEGEEYTPKMKPCYISLKKLKLDTRLINNILASKKEEPIIEKRKVSVVSEVEGIVKKQRTDSNYDYNLVRIWSKFFSFSRKFKWTDAFSPYEATNEEVASFVHYLKLTERVDMSYLEDIVTAMDKYHIRREDHLFKTADRLKLMLKIYPPTFDANPKKFRSPLSSCPVHHSDKKCVWKELLLFCQKRDIDPFKASLIDISTFTDSLLKSEARQNILTFCKDYESAVEFIIEGLREFLVVFLNTSSVHLQSTGPISNLLRAARACDEKLTTNKSATSFLPQDNFIRCLMETDDGNMTSFWKRKSIRNALRDVRKSFISMENVAKEIGITPEMVYAVLQKDVKNNECLPSLDEFLDDGFSQELFWAKWWVTELLNDVRNRVKTSAMVAAQFGVSRKEIEEKCGGIRSKEEIDEEKERKRIKKEEAKEEAAKNRMRTTEIDNQIALAENNQENLCEYEIKRLENLRARKAMMEQLGIVEDRVEIKQVEKRQLKKRDPVARREKSSRVERLKENSRLDFDMETPSSFDTLDEKQIQRLIQKERLTPEGFGKMFKKDESPTPERFIVPKVNLDASQLLEVTKDYRNSRVFLDSVAKEGLILDSTRYRPDSLDWSKFSTSEEFIVSSSSVTALDSLGDFITFGTEAGGVGVLLGGRSATIRPHSDTVTDVVTTGARVMSSSMDGSVRTWDLVTQKSSLEYCWDPDKVDISETRQGVCGMMPWGEQVFLLDCNNRIVNLDTRCSNAPVTMLDVPIFFDAAYMEISNTHGRDRFSVENVTLKFLNTLTIDIEPRSGNQFLVSRDDVVKIYDFRNTGQSVAEFEGNFAAWNPDGSWLYVSQNRGYQVFDVTSGAQNVPGTASYSHSDNSKGLPTIGGNPWCPWNKNSLFQVGKKQAEKFKHNKRTYQKTYLCAFDSQSKVLTGFEVETKEEGHFIVHCHRNQPQVVLANTEGIGRIKLVSAIDES